MGTIPASENEFPEVLFAEGAAPATPASGIVKAYAKSDGLLYSKDDAGTETPLGGGSGGDVATDAIWDAAGDLAVGSGANTAAKLAIGATNGMALHRVGGAVAWALPSGYEFDYAQITSNASITGTSAGAANTVITGNAVTYDGSTRVRIEFYTAFMTPTGTTSADITVGVFESTTEIGRLVYQTTNANAVQYNPAHGMIFITPTAASHTYLIKAWVSAATGTIGAGAGGAAAAPAFMRITKA